MTAAFLIIYLYSFLGFEIFHEDFVISDISIDRNKENACMGLLQCFFTHFSFVVSLNSRDLVPQEE